MATVDFFLKLPLLNFFQMSKTAKCPKCDGEITLADDCEVGEIISCDECSAELEVKALKPETILDDAPEVQEDWGE